MTDKASKQYVWADISELSTYQLSGNLDEVVARLTEHIQHAKANQEYSEVRIEAKPERYADCYCDHLYLQGKRLETDEEYADRTQDEAYKRQMRDEYDRKQYEALKLRFEGK